MGWKIVKKVEDHKCSTPSYTEVKSHRLANGSIIACDCGKQYILVSGWDQRDGFYFYWNPK